MEENNKDTHKDEQIIDEELSSVGDQRQDDLENTELSFNEDQEEAELNEEPPAGVLERTLLNMGVVGELLLLFIKGDRWWMAPLVLLLCVLGAVLVVLNSLEYVAPFIYMAF